MQARFAISPNMGIISADGAELRMIVVGDQANNAAQPVQQERAEVRSQGHREQRIRQGAILSCVL